LDISVYPDSAGSWGFLFKGGCMSDMPIGNCNVCGNPLDHSDAGFCEECGQAFHWNNCGRWLNNKHCCDTCKEFSDSGEIIDLEAPNE